MDCKNCRQDLAEGDDYCGNCGGKVIRNRLTLKNLFHHINEMFFNYDNKLLRTFLNLFRRPEDVIVGYINGVRKKYVDVVSYFALAITLSGLQIFIMNKLEIDMNLYDTATELGKRQQAVFDSTYQYITEYQSLVMMLYIPFYALLAQLVFRRYKKFNYTELLVIFLYAQAQVSICSALLIIISAAFGMDSFSLAGMVAMLGQLTYYVYLLKRVFGLSAKQMLWRTVVFILILMILCLIVIVVTGVVMVQTGVIDELKKAAT